MDFQSLCDAAYSYFSSNKVLKALLPISFVLLFSNAVFWLIALLSGGNFTVVLAITRYLLPLGMVLCMAKREYGLLLCGCALEAVCKLILLISSIVNHYSASGIVSNVIALAVFALLTFIAYKVFRTTSMYTKVRDNTQRTYTQVKQKVDETKARAQDDLSRRTAEREASLLESGKCPYCHAQLRPGSQFCVSCGCALPQRGAGQAAAAAPDVCPDCYKNYAAGMSFCMTCGKPLSAALFPVQSAREPAEKQAPSAPAVTQTAPSAPVSPAPQAPPVAEAAARPIQAGSVPAYPVFHPTAEAAQREPEKQEQSAPAAPVPERGPRNAPAPQEKPATVRCPHCGSQVRGDKPFCTKCGTMLAQTRSVPNVCAVCGTQIPSGNAFCMKCGARVKG